MSEALIHRPNIHVKRIEQILEYEWLLTCEGYYVIITTSQLYMALKMSDCRDAIYRIEIEKALPHCSPFIMDIDFTITAVLALESQYKPGKVFDWQTDEEIFFVSHIRYPQKEMVNGTG